MAACWAAGVVQAASPLMIWPVDPVISGKQRATALWVENRGAQAFSLQARVFHWSQTDGEDRLTPQRDVVASPPISQIPPGARQLIRLIASHPQAPLSEQAYRVLLDELPAAEPAPPPPGLGVKIQLRYSIPLFVQAPPSSGSPQGEAPGNSDRGTALQPNLSWHVERRGERHILVVRNAGRGFARLTHVSWTGASGSTVPISTGLFGYVLAGSERRWQLDAPPPPGGMLQATVNGDSIPVPRASTD